MPLSAKARIEVYLPDQPKAAYQSLLTQLDREFCYTFGGATTVRGLEGSYLSVAGAHVHDRINLIYTDTPLGEPEDSQLLGRYADNLKSAALAALDEEAVLIARWFGFTTRKRMVKS